MFPGGLSHSPPFPLSLHLPAPLTDPLSGTIPRHAAQPCSGAFPILYRGSGCPRARGHAAPRPSLCDTERLSCGGEAGRVAGRRSAALLLELQRCDRQGLRQQPQGLHEQEEAEPLRDGEPAPARGGGSSGTPAVQSEEPKGLPGCGGCQYQHRARRRGPEPSAVLSEAALGVLGDRAAGTRRTRLKSSHQTPPSRSPLTLSPLPGKLLQGPSLQ